MSTRRLVVIASAMAALLACSASGNAYARASTHGGELARNDGKERQEGAASEAVSHGSEQTSPGSDDVDCRPPKQLEVLFIGNSYTKGYNLPGLVETLGEQAGIRLETEVLAVDATNFEFHADRDETAEVLARRDWDVVILQSHSLDTLINVDGFFDAGETLVEMVREEGAEPLLFETWARKPGHSFYENERVSGGSPAAMQSMIRDRYHALAQRTGAEVVEVGEAWLAVQRKAADVDLYASDAHHAGRSGAYLTANVFFAALTGMSPVGKVDPLLGIEPREAKLLQAEAAAVVRPECSEKGKPAPFRAEVTGERGSRVEDR